MTIAKSPGALAAPRAIEIENSSKFNSHSHSQPELQAGEKRRRRNSQPEQIIHRAVVQHLRARGVPGLVFFHVPNGGKRGPVEAAIFKSLGVRAGVADLILFHAGKSFALELKADNGRPTAEQIEFLADIERAGAFTAMPRGLDAALATLETWGLLRGSLSKLSGGV
jgi:hypothetical protein